MNSPNGNGTKPRNTTLMPRDLTRKDVLSNEDITAMWEITQGNLNGGGSGENFRGEVKSLGGISDDEIAVEQAARDAFAAKLKELPAADRRKKWAAARNQGSESIDRSR